MTEGDKWDVEHRRWKVWVLWRKRHQRVGFRSFLIWLAGKSLCRWGEKGEKNGFSRTDFQDRGWKQKIWKIGSVDAFEKKGPGVWM